MSSCRSEDPFTSACLSIRACASGLRTPSQPGPLTSAQVRKHTHLVQVSRQVKVCVLSEGSWENQGLGVVEAAGAELVWTYTASQLGHWVAAPLPSSEGKDPPPSWTGGPLSLDLEVGALAATLLLLLLLAFLALLLCHCRSDPGSAEAPPLEPPSRPPASPPLGAPRNPGGGRPASPSSRC